MQGRAQDAQRSDVTPDSGVRSIRRWTSRRGQFAVELALIAPVLAIVLLGSADLGRVFYMSIALNNAARAGVQYGAQNATTAANLTAMQTAATNDAAGISGVSATASEYCQCPTGASFSCSTTNSCSDKRVYVKVVTSGTFTTLINYPGLPHTVSLTGTAVMREQ
jgi:Flp pilus assembly protein TadG